jgi:protein phosphatase
MSDAQRDSGEISVAADAARAREPAPEGGSVRIGVRCAGRTAVGQVRDHNEDNLVVANLGSGVIRPRDQVFEDEVGERGLIFAVCDGMGGAAAGEVASQMAVDILVEAMRRGGSPKNRDALARRLVGAVEEAGRRIFDAAQKERSRRGMGTTATVAVLVDKVMFLAEVGDSRAYLLRRGQLKQLTKDQSLVNQLIEAGHLTEDEAEAFEHSNIILQALGTSETVQVDLTFVELRRGDRLMLCSDGLSGLVHADALRTTLEQITDPAACCTKLIEFAETAGGHDNITVVVADFAGEGLAEPGDTDSFGYVQYPLPLADSESSAFVDEDTTSAGGDARRHSLTEQVARERIERDEEMTESLLPLSGDGGDTRANALWILGGVLALVAAVIVWLRLDPVSGEGEHIVLPETPAARAAPGASAGSGQAPAAETQEVEVNVHTDIERATLVVNGETKGDLSSVQSRSLKLRPGAYRFDAHSGGSLAASTVVTVRGDMPMDVFLQLPTGGSPRAPGEEAPPEGEAEKPPTALAEQPVPGKTPEEVAETEPKPESAAPRRPRAPAAEPTPTSVEPALTVKPRSGGEDASPDGTAREPAAPVTPPAAAERPARREPRAETAPSAPPEATAGRTPTTAAPAPKPAEIPENPF